MAAPGTQSQSKLVRWIDHRLPIFTFMQHELNEYPTPRNSELLVELRFALRDHAGDHDRHRHLPRDGLHAARRLRLRFRRAHHARREFRLADALHPHERRVDLLHRRLHPPLPRPLLRLLQGAARAVVDARRDHPAADDGDRLHGLRAALGADELLGRHRHHQSVLRDPRGGGQDRHLALGRLRRRQSDAQPLLLAALPAALRHRRRGRAASRSRCISTARTIRSASTARGRRTASPSTPTTPSRTCSGWACS